MRDIDAPFGQSNGMMETALARPEFEPFLREAMWTVLPQDFAIATIRQLGEARLVAALHATLDSGSAWAAAIAADSLLRRGDSTAIRWLRRQVERADAPIELEPEGGPLGGWPIRGIVYLLASHDDTASIPSWPGCSAALTRSSPRRASSSCSRR